jgi:hypothetical protein
MNKEQALNKLAALEAETKALRAIIEAPDTPVVPTRWRPEDGEAYYMVSNGGYVLPYEQTPLLSSEYIHGNCFQTREHAEIAAKAVSVTLKVCAAAFAVDPDAGVQLYAVRSWSVARRDFTLSGKDQWVAGQYDATTSHPCYVHTPEQAQQMATILNAEGV